VTIESEIRAAVGSKKAILGYRQALKRAKRGEVKKIVVASSCPEQMRSELDAAAAQGKIDVARFEGDSAELGSLCGKPFKIAVIAISK